MAGVMAAVGVVAALHYRSATGKGQLVDLATHDVVSLSNELGIPYWEFQKANIWRHTGRHASVQETRPREMFRCMDGKYMVCMTKYIDRDSQFRVLIDWLDQYGLAGDLVNEEYADSVYRIEQAGHIADVIEQFCAQRHSRDVFHEAQARGLPWGPVNDPRDLVSDPHIAVDRKAVVEMGHSSLGETFVYPGPPYKFSATPWSLRSVAPELGEDTADILGPLSMSPLEIALARRATGGNEPRTKGAVPDEATNAN
jgi:crotonobetainyl-CoA:carnitine CoA-transferase CaiB-like acyl-CoA transferase